MEQRKRWVAAISAGVSPEGQNLYMAISKTINQVSGGAHMTPSSANNFLLLLVPNRIGDLGWREYSCIQ